MREIVECFSYLQRVSYLISFSILAEIEASAVHVKYSIYLCWLPAKLQSMSGTQIFMKCGRSRPIVYLAMSVNKTVQMVPNPNTPTCAIDTFFIINMKK
jgi:hypothetical protein